MASGWRQDGVRMRQDGVRMCQDGVRQASHVCQGRGVGVRSASGCFRMRQEGVRVALGTRQDYLASGWRQDDVKRLGARIKLSRSSFGTRPRGFFSCLIMHPHAHPRRLPIVAHWTPSPGQTTQFHPVPNCSLWRMAKHRVPRLGRGVPGFFALTHPLTPCHQRGTWPGS